MKSRAFSTFHHGGWATALAAVLFLGSGVLAAPTDNADQLAPDLPAIPATPDGTIEVTSRAMAEGQPVVMWHALPRQYQEDVQFLVRGYAGHFDEASYNKTFSVLKKLTRILKEKKEFVFGHPMVAMQMAQPDARPEETKQAYDGIVGAIDAFVNSDLSTLEGLRTVDVEAYLRNDGAEIADHLLAVAALSPEGTDVMTELEAEVVEIDGDTATVRIQAPGQEPQEQVLTRVDGRWLPAEMVASWDENIAAAKAALAEATPETTKQYRMQVMMIGGMIEGMLDSIDAAQTQQEFNQAVGMLMQGMPGAGGMGGPGGMGPGNAQPEQPREMPAS